MLLSGPITYCVFLLAASHLQLVRVAALLPLEVRGGQVFRLRAAVEHVHRHGGTGPVPQGVFGVHFLFELHAGGVHLVPE